MTVGDVIWREGRDGTGTGTFTGRYDFRMNGRRRKGTLVSKRGSCRPGVSR